MFTAFWRSDGQVVAAMHANDWDAIASVRAIAGSRVAAAQLRDESVPLDRIAAGSLRT